MNNNLEGESMEAGELIWSTSVTLIQPSGTSARDLKAGPPEYKATVLLPS
jgi:hypothetical protein